MAKHKKKYYRKQPAVQKGKVEKYLLEGYSKRGKGRYDKSSPEFKEASKEVTKELRKRKLKSTLANVRAIHSELYIKPVATAKKKAKAIPPRPELPEMLFDIDAENHKYWEFEECLRYISALPKDLLIKSPTIWGKGVVVNGGDDLDYMNYGQEWVNYIDQHVRPTLTGGSDDVPHWLFINHKKFFFFNRKYQKWMITLASVDSTGLRTAFGLFTIKGLRVKPQEDVPTEKKSKEPEAPAETPKVQPVEESPETIKAKAEAEVIKKKGDAEAKAIEQESLLKRLIEEKKSLLDELKIWNEIGETEEYAFTLKRIKEVKTKIEKLNA